MTTTTFKVTGMTCGCCETSVRQHVTAVEGVKDLNVDAATGELVVTGTADTEAVLAAVGAAGYEASPNR
jgi:copper chaperone CopZ